MSQDKFKGRAQFSYICSKMNNQIYATEVEYVTENGNTRARVNGCAETSVIIRGGYEFSCISESLFTKLQERVD